MYKLITVLTIVFVSSTMFFTVQAQEPTNGNTSRKLAYQEGDVSINAGISLGLIGYGWGYGWNHSFSLPLTVNVDIGVHEYFSAGGYVGYMGRSYTGSTYGGYKFKHTFRSYSFGAQGTFHASTFLNEEFDFAIDDKKVDYYVRLLLGYETYSWKWDDGYNFGSINSESSGRMIFGPVLGVRYMFSPNIGGYVEGGRGAFGWLTLGASFKM